MSTAFKAAKAALGGTPRPSVEDFIKHAKNNYVELALMFGGGFVVQAVEIAEELLYRRSACSNCGMLICECEEYE